MWSSALSRQDCSSREHCPLARPFTIAVTTKLGTEGISSPASALNTLCSCSATCRLFAAMPSCSSLQNGSAVPCICVQRFGSTWAHLNQASKRGRSE